MSATNLLILTLFVPHITAAVVPTKEIDWKKEHPDAGLNTVELIKKHGYPCESHQIRTEDDYILTMHRIPHGRNNANQKNKTAVLLMHGLLSSSSDWIMIGPDRSLGYILADLGYDVWIGNARGNTWSKKHMYLDPGKDKELFWDFSWHEIGYYDLPAKIDHILKTTGQEQIFYFGHSQGCTSFFVMATTRPEYNNKIRLSSMLAPPAYMSNVETKILHLLSKHHAALEWLAKFVGLYEFMPNTELLSMIGQKQCHDEAPFQELCANIFFLIAGYDSEQLNRTMLPVMMTNFPAGASSKQLLHYAHGIKSGKFRHFDYGWRRNLIKYKSTTPPKYNLNKISAPVALYYSLNDNMVGTKDVDTLANELPNLVLKHLVPYKKFTHFDFLTANDVVELLYDDVLRTMQEHK